MLFTGYESGYDSVNSTEQYSLDRNPNGSPSGPKAQVRCRSRANSPVQDILGFEIGNNN